MKHDYKHHNTFTSDLNDAKKIEREVIDFLNENFSALSDFLEIETYIEKHNNDAKLSDFDFICTYTKNNKKHKIKFEIKHDKMSSHTNNFAIEYKNNYKNCESGIETTKADYYIIVDEEKYNLIKVSDLKAYINENIHKINSVKGGYQKRASMYLISKEKIKNINKIFDRF